jgi:carbon monoxide dehydrogenase subunit G
VLQGVARTAHVTASPGEVWTVLLDFERVASWLSVVRDLREIVPRERYTTVLEDHVGPFGLRADLAIDVSADPVQRRLQVTGSGEDRQIASRISATLGLAVVATATGSDVVVTGSYEITGRIATLGAGAIRKKGDRVLDEFFARLTRELGAA